MPRDDAAHACRSCSWFGAARGAPGHRRLRDVPIERSDVAFCASHSAHGGGADRAPVGPVLLSDGAEARVLITSRDSPGVREHLRELIERIEVHGGRPSSLRDATAIWQLQQLGWATSVPLDRPGRGAPGEGRGRDRRAADARVVRRGADRRDPRGRLPVAAAWPWLGVRTFRRLGIPLRGDVEPEAR